MYVRLSYYCQLIPSVRESRVLPSHASVPSASVQSAAIVVQARQTRRRVKSTKQGCVKSSSPLGTRRKCWLSPASDKLSPRAPAPVRSVRMGLPLPCLTGPCVRHSPRSCPQRAFHINHHGPASSSWLMALCGVPRGAPSKRTSVWGARGGQGRWNVSNV